MANVKKTSTAYNTAGQFFALGKYTALVASILFSISAHGSDSPFGEDWPSGPGSMETGGLCGACHSLALVKQQGLSRKSWDETLTWMVEEQGMPDLDPDMRNLILDYLSEHFNPESRHRD
ncbi:hypothetical protein [Hahella ganghwensis]|uniref:hypothetical protein n=1 Tax=Hahella ganghwensis TaxID=286420 RepID=UPI001FE11AD7|nr:hypothetical protein [Hahella ganghwensis]